jgi:hypothetical protein
VCIVVIIFNTALRLCLSLRWCSVLATVLSAVLDESLSALLTWLLVRSVGSNSLGAVPDLAAIGLTLSRLRILCVHVYVYIYIYVYMCVFLLFFFYECVLLCLVYFNGCGGLGSF